MKGKIKLLLLLFLALSACSKRTGEPFVELTTDTGTFSITSRYVGLKKINSIVYISINGIDREVNLSDIPTQESVDYFDDHLGSGVQTLIEGESEDGIRIALTINDYNKNFFTIKIEVENISVPQLTVKGFALSIDGSNGSDVMGSEKIKGQLANGYQSWSPSVVSKLLEAKPEDEPSFDNVENNEDTLFVDFRTSWWFSGLYSPEQSIVSGTLTSERFKTKILNYLSDGQLVWKVKCGKTYVNNFSAEDKITLTPGQSTSSEIIFIGIYSDVLSGLEEYARSVALINQPPSPPFIPVGWNSWNELFSDINEQKILNNAQFIKENFPEHGFNNIQIDDGWERSWGDWEPNSNFPSQMYEIATQIKKLGFIPGIWLAPFLVSDSAPVYTQHKDWLLKDENGSLLKYEKYYILDTTNPSALNWLVSEIDKILNWGYRYLKLDFLFSGAYEGKRFDGETSMSAYRSAMRAILEEAKKANAYVLACGAPLIPTAGLAHGARIGGDIALSALPYSFSFIKNEARNIANRFFLNRIFANDPDTALLRDIPIEEAKMNLTSVLLSGKIFALGDDLLSLPPEKINLIQKIKSFPIFNEIKNSSSPNLFMKPVDMFNNFSEPSTSVATLFVYPETYYDPSIWSVKINETSVVVGIFNWDDEEKMFNFTVDRIGLEKEKKYSAFELWSGNELSVITDSYETTLYPHSAELIYIFQE